MRIYLVLSVISTVSLSVKSLASPLPSTNTADLQALSCLTFQDLSFYDMRALANPTNDYQVQCPITKTMYTFNLCQFTLSTCPGQPNTFAYKVDDTNTCTLIADNNLQNINTTIVYDPTETYVRMQFAGG